MASVSNAEVDPEVMEQTVAKVLEPRLATTEDAVLITSSSEEGRTSVELHFSYGTDIDVALRDASTKLDQARGALPEEADPPTIFKFDPSQIPVLQFAVFSPSRDQAWIKRWSEDQLAKQLLTVEGVASVDVIGGLDREIQVVIDPDRLRSYGLTVSEVLDRLREENQDISAGRLRSRGRELLSKTKGKFRGVEDIRQVRLPLAGGGDISVADVAEIVDTYADDRIYTRMDLRPAVMVAVTKQPDANTVRVVDSCLAVLERLRRDGFFPPDVATQLIQDQAFYVRAAVSGVANAALAGGGLAMVVVFLFLRSFRRTLVIGTSIPIAILGCVALMGTADLTLNIMSLGGLALGIGMLVDNAIVMLENIDRHQRESEDPVEAAHSGRRRGGVGGHRLDPHQPRGRPPLLPDGRPHRAAVQRAPGHHLLRHPDVARGGADPGSDARRPAVAVPRRAGRRLEAPGRAAHARSLRSKVRIGGCCRACCAAAGWWWSGPWPPAPPASPSPPASAASSCLRSTTAGSACGSRCRPRLPPR